ncbi:hypothetical protein JOJ87_001432 [Rhodococcus ruber]|uniref:hypothetical protein n=1 Tax=Rhodococcus ruber TaxID=1830 RepID=UPI001AE918B6|nr:hypothetical protein [Rhodococcus ruber]MBP2211088.1 hypothetical protein [Rhodococcus ruber]
MIPTPYTVGVRTYTESGKDDRGNPVESWSAPVDHPVYGWSMPSSTEPKVAGHNRVLVSLELLVPPTFPAKAHDRVVVDGEEFEVLGRPEDFNHGPFGFAPGLVVNLGRTEG